MLATPMGWMPDPPRQAYKRHRASGVKSPMVRAILSAHGKQLIIAGGLLGLEFSMAVSQSVMLGLLLNGPHIIVNPCLRFAAYLWVRRSVRPLLLHMSHSTNATGAHPPSACAGAVAEQHKKK